MEEKDEKSYESLNDIGVSLFAKGDYEEALSYFEKAIKIKNSEVTLYYNKASCEENLYRYNEAIQDYNKGLEINPKNIKILYSLFKLYKIKGDFEKGLDVIDKIIIFQPYNNSTYIKERDSLQDLQNESKRNEILMKNEEFLEAEEVCKNLLKECPQAHLIQIDYIKILLSKEKYAKIMSFIKEKVCEENKKTHMYFNYYLGLSLYYCDKIEDAKKILLEIVENKDYNGSFKKKSDELFKKIEYEETINEKIDTLIESREYEEVINIADSVMKINSKKKKFISEILFSRGFSYFVLDKKLEALNDCNESIKIYPYNADAYAFRAAIYTSLKSFDNAKKDEEKAKKLYKDDSQFEEIMEMLEDIKNEITKRNSKKYNNKLSKKSKNIDSNSDHESLEESFKESLEEPLEKASDKPLKKYSDKSSEESLEEPLEKASDKPIEKYSDKSLDEFKYYEPKLEKFFKILPCVLKSNSDNNIESYNSCLKEIPKNKIIIKHENKFYCKELENNSHRSIIEDVNISLKLSMLNKGADFKHHFSNNKELAQENYSIVIKRILYSISIKEEDIMLTTFFKNKLKKISNLNISDEEKAERLDELFKENGLYIPLKFYVGGLFYINTTNMSRNQRKSKLEEINADLKIKLLDMKKEIDIHNEINNKSNYKEKSKRIIGGEINENYKEWIETINLENSDVIEYAEFRNVIDFLDEKLEKELNGPIEFLKQKYKKRVNYIRIIEELKEKKRNNNYFYGEGNYDFKIGKCEKDNPDIKSERYSLYEEYSYFVKNTRGFNRVYQDTIVGLEINSLKNSNGKFDLKNPLLGKELDISFTSDRNHSLYYEILVYLMKCPE